jgi:hypothetical protein
MNALQVIAEWLRGHWAALAAIVYAIAVITTICFLPADIRKGALITLAVILVAIAGLFVWAAEPWTPGHFDFERGLLLSASGIGAIGVFFAAWAWLIW